ncbi:pilin N-terminal domain-containing protein [Enterococcus faecium]|uniref:pilin N-terminal domain-containing protein n=1 Tax=Enterococcus faecium TaxID=1352 RepID=UPI003CE56D2B
MKSETSPYSVFKWGDTAGQGLSYVAAKANIKVTNKDGSVVLKENTDYKIQNSENGFVIDFIVNNGQVSDTVASLHGQDLQMTYNMYVNQGQKLEKQEGVNGAKFSVYDVSDILQKMDVKDLTTDQIESQLKDRVKKLFSDQLKLVSNGETKTIDQQTGVFEFSIEVQANQKQAYYIVNESSPENISNSEDILLLTPVSDKNGEFLKDVWIYPKSEASQPNALKKVNRLFQPLRSENTNGNWKH